MPPPMPKRPLTTPMATPNRKRDSTANSGTTACAMLLPAGCALSRPMRSSIPIAAHQLLFHLVGLPGDGGDGAADVEGGGGAGELREADDDHVAAGRALHAERAHHH